MAPLFSGVRLTGFKRFVELPRAADRTGSTLLLAALALLLLVAAASSLLRMTLGAPAGDVYRGRAS